MEPMTPTWRKSTYSSGNGGECVEVGSLSRAVFVRDTKDHGAGPVLAMSPIAWRRFAAVAGSAIRPRVS